MTASRSTGSDPQQGPHADFASEVPPTLFRLRTVHAPGGASLASSTARPPESGFAGNLSPVETSPVEADSFPPPPAVAARVDDFPPPPLQPIAAESDELPAPRGDREQRGHRSSRERHSDHVRRGRDPENNAPAGRSWTELLGSRLVLVMLLAVAVGVFFVITNNTSDDSIRLAEEDSESLMAELGIGEISTGTPVSNAELMESSDAASLPEFSSVELSASEQDPQPSSLDGSTASDRDNAPASVQPWAGNAEFAAGENSSASAGAQPAPKPAENDGGVASIDWDAEAGLSESGMRLDPALGTEIGEHADGAGIAVGNEPSAVREPQSINEPTPAGELDLVAPQSPYDSRLSQENDYRSHSAMTPAPQPSNRQGAVSEPTSDTPRQTAMPYAVTDWSKYFPPESNPAAGGVGPAAGGGSLAVDPGTNPYAYGAAPQPGAAPQYGLDPRVAQLPSGYPAGAAVVPTNQPAGQFQGAAGYSPQNGYSSPNGYVPQSGYALPNGYAPQSGYMPQGTAPAAAPANASGFGIGQPTPAPADPRFPPYSPYDAPQQ